MKRNLKFFLFFLLSLPAVAQTSKAGDEKLVKDLIVNSFQEIFSENKQEKLLQYFTDDFLLLEDGEVWDMKIIRGYMERAAAMDRRPERINFFEWIEVKVSENMAWAAYHNRAVFKVDGQVVGEMNWLESASAVRTADGWRLELLHSTVKEEE